MQLQSAKSCTVTTLAIIYKPSKLCLSCMSPLQAA